MKLAKKISALDFICLYLIENNDHYCFEFTRKSHTEWLYLWSRWFINTRFILVTICGLLSRCTCVVSLSIGLLKSPVRMVASHFSIRRVVLFSSLSQASSASSDFGPLSRKEPRMFSGGDVLTHRWIHFILWSSFRTLQTNPLYRVWWWGGSGYWFWTVPDFLIDANLLFSNLTFAVYILYCFPVVLFLIIWLLKLLFLSWFLLVVI